MKTRSKDFLSMMCAVLLIAASVMGTMAYLQDKDTVTNTFAVGKVDLTLDEAAVNDDGTPIDGADRVKANNYKLMPGHEYTKDPTIHVDSESEDCYLFVTVENEIANIEADPTIKAQMTANGWNVVNETAGLYVYGPTNAPTEVTGGTSILVFGKFKVAGTVDNTDLASYKDKTIVVDAYAVQKDGFENKTAAEIWSATFGA